MKLLVLAAFSFVAFALGSPVAAQNAAETASEPAAAAPGTADPNADATADTSEGEEDAQPSTEPEDDQPDLPPMPESPGQPDLDKAAEAKLSVRGLPDLNRVVELLDSALEKGLDEASTEFAESMLVATLMDRATALSGAVLKQPVADPRRDPRWVQVRQIALTDLQRVVAMDDSIVEAHLLIGRLHSLPLGDPNAARRALTKVIKADEVADELKAQAYAMRGATQQDSERQKSDFEKAVELQPEKAEYYLLLGRAAMRDGDSEAAHAAMQEAAELAPDNVQAQVQLGVSLIGLDRLDEALAALDRATELDPKAIEPYLRRSEIYSRRGEQEQALGQLDKAVEIDPNTVATRLMRAQMLSRDERFDEALEDVEHALRQQPGSLQAHLMRVGLLDQLDRDEEALETLEKIVEVAPQLPEIHLRLAAMYMDADRHTEAIDSLSTVLELAGDNELALRLRGDMYLTVGKHKEALADFARSYENNPEDSGLLNNYAWTLATSPFDDVRNGEKAVELALKAAELTEYQKPHILSTVAAAYAESGDFDKAIEWSQKAIALEQEQASSEADQRDPGDPQDIEDQLSEELASYRAGKPWRELQQPGDPNAAIDGPADESSTAPAPPPEPEGVPQTIDF